MTPEPAETIRGALQALPDAETLDERRKVDLCEDALEALAVLQRQLAETEAYAKEGWDWLSEALEALGAKTVFDIEARERQLAEKDEALRAILDVTHGSLAGRDSGLDQIDKLAREALRAEPAKEQA